MSVTFILDRTTNVRFAQFHKEEYCCPIVLLTYVNGVVGSSCALPLVVCMSSLCSSVYG